MKPRAVLAQTDGRNEVRYSYSAFVRLLARHPSLELPSHVSYSLSEWKRRVVQHRAFLQNLSDKRHRRHASELPPRLPPGTAADFKSPPQLVALKLYLIRDPAGGKESGLRVRAQIYDRARRGASGADASLEDQTEDVPLGRGWR